jgi:hypothetical protein
LALLGFPDRARDVADDAIALAERLGHPFLYIARDQALGWHPSTALLPRTVAVQPVSIGRL